MKIILAQGNPEKRYETTRHNIGWIILDSYADSVSANWKESVKHKSLLAEVTINGEKVLLVKPLTYYNDTGLAARSLLNFYKFTPADDLLVIHDDLVLPLGTIRARNKGRDAGNNGIKSLNSHIGEDYNRIRVGTWSEIKEHMTDFDFVLSSFSKDERAKIDADITPVVIRYIDSFIKGNLELNSVKV